MVELDGAFCRHSGLPRRTFELDVPDAVGKTIFQKPTCRPPHGPGFGDTNSRGKRARRWPGEHESKYEPSARERVIVPPSVYVERKAGPRCHCFNYDARAYPSPPIAVSGLSRKQSEVRMAVRCVESRSSASLGTAVPCLVLLAGCGRILRPARCVGPGSGARTARKGRAERQGRVRAPQLHARRPAARLQGRVRDRDEPEPSMWDGRRNLPSSEGAPDPR
jgi:hypothetical protein